MFHHSSCLRLRLVRLLSYSLPTLFVLASVPDVASGQPAKAPPPLVTELLGLLDLSRLHAGSPLTLGVDYDWSGAGCTLRAGSFVQGRVVALVKHSKTSKDTELQLAFDSADCNGRAATPRGFTLVALVGPARTGDGSTTPLGGLDAAPATIGAGRSLEASSANNLFEPQTRSLPAHIQMGQVLYVAQTSLRVGKGEAGATVISGAAHDVQLERGTNLILIVREAPKAAVPGAATAVESKGQASTGVNGADANNSSQAPKRD